MGQGETAGQQGRLLPPARGGTDRGGGSTTAGGTAAARAGRTAGAAPGARGNAPSPTLPPPVPPVPPGAPAAAPPARPANLETADAAELLSGALHAWAADFLRSLRRHSESAGSAETAAEAAEAVRSLRRTGRRLGGTLHTYRSLLDAAWADRLAVELRWLSDTLSREYLLAARLERLHGALHRLVGDSGGDGSETGSGRRSAAGGGARSGTAVRGGGQDTLLPAGAARASALLERQLTLARTRAHSAALQALVSGRFHAVADAVAVLASEVPLAPDGAQGRTAAKVLVPPADQARQRLVQAVGTLRLPQADVPGQADTFTRPVTVRTSRMREDAAWHEVRVLLRLHRYAEEVLLSAERAVSDDADGSRSWSASARAVLDGHRDAVEAAEAAASAARTPRIAPATAYALGVLHADQRQEVEAARAAFGRLWHQPRPQAPPHVAHGMT